MWGLKQVRKALHIRGSRSIGGDGLSRIGSREVVGYGVNGMFTYKDDPHFPFPAIRFKEETEKVKELREKEKGDWRELTLDEKKTLYRTSFCQTYAEFQHYTGEWKFVLGAVFICLAFPFWCHMLNHHYVKDPPLASFSEESRQAQLKRMLDLKVNPVDGLSSKYDYENNRWK